LLQPTFISLSIVFNEREREEKGEIETENERKPEGGNGKT
jgi:hypothetical protein